MPSLVESFASEDLLQAACVRWHNLHFRSVSVLHSVPNGGNMHPVERMKLVATGMLAGAADLELKLPGGRTIHIELKNGTKPLDPKQVVFRERIEKLGFEYHKAGSFREFALLICRLLEVDPSLYL